MCYKKMYPVAEEKAITTFHTLEVEYYFTPSTERRVQTYLLLTSMKAQHILKERYEQLNHHVTSQCDLLVSGVPRGSVIGPLVFDLHTPPSVIFYYILIVHCPLILQITD